MDYELKTPAELQGILGQRLKTLRINRNFSQVELAGKAGISLKTLRNLEMGNGSSVETLIRVLKALNLVKALESISPTPTISPLEILKNSKVPQRVRRAARRI
jgi:transcriptional regulator with XRE-family HTH domain